MNELRKFLGLLFGFVAFSLVSTTLLPTITAAHSLRPGTALHVLSVSLFHSTFIIGASIFNGMACWAVLMNRRPARILGIAASVTPFLGMAVFLALGLIYRSSLPPSGLVWVTLGLAIAGLLAFVPRSMTAQIAEKPPLPIRGDGTRAWINKSVWILGTLVFILSLDWWYRWGGQQGLALGGWVSSLFQCIVAELLIVLLHEFGHSITGLALGMKLRAFIVGPFQWQIDEGKWEFHFKPARFLSTGGATALVPTDPRQPLWRECCMIAAGPATSLVFGPLALWAALESPSTPWESAWFFLACIATLSLIAGVLNLLPFQTGLTYSDGARLYQLALRGPWADYHRAVAIVTSTLVTQRRPRDYDIQAIQRASSAVLGGHRVMVLHLFASSYYLDRGAHREAAYSLDQAERVFKESALDIPAALHTPFVFGKAFLERDANGTREWWERMEAKKTSRFNVDYWLANAAHIWMEGRNDEALVICEKAYLAASKLPSFGEYEFDRYRCSLLRAALGEPSLTSLSSESLLLKNSSSVGLGRR